MLIEVRLFGHLRRYSGDPTANRDTIVHLPASGKDTVGGVLARVGVELEEVGNLFLNGRLLPRSIYPITLGYQLAAPAPLSADAYLATPVQPGDRVGIFPRNMSSVVV